MPLRLTVTQRALVAGVAAAGLLMGAFAAGGARGDAATLPGNAAAAQAAPGARITVTGTGTVSGTPDQLMLYMGVQTNASSVSAALQRANRAVSAVTRARHPLAGAGLARQPAGDRHRHRRVRTRLTGHGRPGAEPTHRPAVAPRRAHR